MMYLRYSCGRPRAIKYVALLSTVDDVYYYIRFIDPLPYCIAKSRIKRVGERISSLPIRPLKAERRPAACCARKLLRCVAVRALCMRTRLLSRRTRANVHSGSRRESRSASDRKRLVPGEREQICPQGTHDQSQLAAHGGLDRHTRFGGGEWALLVHACVDCRVSATWSTGSITRSLRARLV